MTEDERREMEDWELEAATCEKAAAGLERAAAGFRKMAEELEAKDANKGKVHNRKGRGR